MSDGCGDPPNGIRALVVLSISIDGDRSRNLLAEAENGCGCRPELPIKLPP